MKKAFLILEDGTVFEGKSIGVDKEIISEIVFNTSMTGYLEVLTDPSYAGQAVTMTYPLIGNYGICYKDMESKKGWPDGFIVRELARVPSNFRSEDTVQHFLEKNDIPGISGIDTRALTKILREKGTMNGMITTNENYNLDEIIPKLKEYTVTGVVKKVSCDKIEKYVPGDIGSESVAADKDVAVIDVGTKKNIIRCLLNRGCNVTVYPCDFDALGMITSIRTISGFVSTIMLYASSPLSAFPTTWIPSSFSSISPNRFNVCLLSSAIATETSAIAFPPELS